MLSKADIKLIRSLADKASRVAEGLFVVEGEKVTGEALASGLVVERLLVADGCSDPAIVSHTLGEHVSGKEMERVSRLKTPSACLALVRIPKAAFNPKVVIGELVLALDDVQDPGNLGTIIRVADWFGISNIVCSPSSADCFNPKVVQSAMGAVFRVKVHYRELAPWLKEAAASGAPIYGTFLDGENISTAKLSTSGIIVMGSEGRGISHAVAGTVTKKLFIPPYPAGRAGSESLNVGTAASVICYEFRRRG